MDTRYSDDAVSLTDLKATPGKIAEYELVAEDGAFIRAVVAGLADIEAGREVSWSEARKRLGLE